MRESLLLGARVLMFLEQEHDNQLRRITLFLVVWCQTFPGFSLTASQCFSTQTACCWSPLTCWDGWAELSPQMSDLRGDQDQVVYYSYIFKEKLKWKKMGRALMYSVLWGQITYLPIIYVGNMYLYAFISEKSSLHLRWTSFVKCRKTYYDFDYYKVCNDFF